MKYILVEFEQGEVKRRFPFIFPEAVVHADMYRYVKQLIRDQTVEAARGRLGNHFFASDFKIVSAGKLSSTVLKGFHGGSETLDTKSRHEVDDQFISMFDYNHGIVP